VAEAHRYSVKHVAFLAGTVCLIVFVRAVFCDFVNFDDQESILENVVIRSLDSNLITGAFSTSMFGLWMPLTWLSYAVDFHFWGFNPLGYHLTNIVLHAVNTGLVVLVADRVLQSKEARSEGLLYPALLLFAALLWGIHPLRAESVVWVTERKDVLNGLFALSSILAYLHYAERIESGALARRFYLISLALFACSLMAKPVTVVLPVMLLVLDWYPLGRAQRNHIASLLVEKLPFFLFSVALSVLTLVTAVDKDMLVKVERLSIGERFLVAGNALFEYVRLLVVPVGILPLHSLPYPIPDMYLATSVISLLVVCCCVYCARRMTAVPAVYLLFLLPLLPVLGFLQNGQQAFAVRYTYLPHSAVSIAVAAILLKSCRASGGNRVRYVVGTLVVILLILAGMTQQQIGIWNNSGALWTRVIEHQPVSLAYKSRGAYYLLSGRYADAVPDFTAAMETAVGQEKLEIFNLLAGRGMALGSLGRFDESIRDFSAAIDLFPHPAYYYSRGITFESMGRMKEARDDLRRAGPNPGYIKWFVYGKGLRQ
jgi:hypothetical protein